MPAVTVEDTLVLPRVPRSDPTFSVPRPVTRVVKAGNTMEGAGFPVRRAFPGLVPLVDVDPFLLLDHVGPATAAPGESKGAPWHPHRGFETVTYVLDGGVAHEDSTGGGGVIGEGETQWMTAGSGIQHDERPSDDHFRLGGPTHAVQLWVNLPPALKMTPPRYQAIDRDAVVLLTSHDGGALIRLIAGELAGFEGPGATHTPITYSHITLAAGARLELPWDRHANALIYTLTGRGSVGPDERPIDDGHLAMFGDGDHVVVRASDTGPLDLLLIGGRPIKAPIVHHGPFVMNTKAEIRQAIEDYRSGRLGQIPAHQLSPNARPRPDTSSGVTSPSRNDSEGAS
ncbi:MAG: pirin family protein [Microthrixaceae bacterium]|nr:pirin family protein [Microthrixaceae bacterium]